MRIVLTVNFSPWSPYSGGGQRSTDRLATALAERGHRVTVVYTRAPGEHIPVPPEVPYAIRWAWLPHPRSRRDAPLRPLTALSVARVVHGLVRRRPRTVVHAQGEEAAALPWLRARRPFRFLLTPRYPAYPDALLAERPGLAARLRLYAADLKYVTLGLAARGADLCCPTSRAAAALVHRAYGIPQSRLAVVPNGVDPAFLALERRAGAHHGPLVFFGRLAHGKGPDLLLEALARLGPDGPRAVLVGRGDERAALERQAAALGLADRVSFPGWESAPLLARRLAGAAAAVLPSREESFGNAMLEALAVGVPLITTRVGSIPELVTSRTARLVPPDDVAALAAALREVLGAPRCAAALGRAGRRHVRAAFSWARTAERFEALYGSPRVGAGAGEVRCAS